jgi:predicted PurR-regulated permease PerM
MAKQGALSALGKGGMSELWARLRFLFLAIIVYRIGAHIPVPGINPDRLADLFRQNEGTILSLFNMFSGGALERMSIFALGIMPYISASIIMQLMTAVSPQLEQLKKVMSLFGFLAGLALVPVYVFYFLLEKRGINQNWTDYLPVRDSWIKEEIVFVLRSINDCLIVFFLLVLK